MMIIRALLRSLQLSEKAEPVRLRWLDVRAFEEKKVLLETNHGK